MEKQLDMLETLRRSGAISAIARQLEISALEATNGAAAALPALLRGFRRRSENAGCGEAGLRDLVAMLGVLGGGAWRST